MTKQHWLSCADPLKMLGDNRFQLSPRKLQLFESGVYWFEKDDPHPSLENRAHLLRDVFDLMDGGLQTLLNSEGGRLWATETITKLAESIYDSRDFKLMPMLADVLEESGCTNVIIIDHCRSSLPHCRGCWVIDLILGLE